MPSRISTAKRKAAHAAMRAAEASKLARISSNIRESKENQANNSITEEPPPLEEYTTPKVQQRRSPPHPQQKKARQLNEGPVCEDGDTPSQLRGKKKKSRQQDNWMSDVIPRLVKHYLTYMDGNKRDQDARCSCMTQSKTLEVTCIFFNRKYLCFSR